MTETVNHPQHYNAHPSGVECIDIVRHFNFNLGNAIKYLWRAGLKPGVDALEDLRKAEWYIQDERKRLGEQPDLTTRPLPIDILPKEVWSAIKEANYRSHEEMMLVREWLQTQMERERKDGERMYGITEKGEAYLETLSGERPERTPAQWRHSFEPSFVGAPSPDVRWWAVDANGQVVWFEGEDPPYANETYGTWMRKIDAFGRAYPIKIPAWKFENNTDWKTTLRKVQNEDLPTVGVVNLKKEEKFGKPSIEWDWSVAPEWANWVAIDSNGRWYWLEQEPDFEKDIWRVENGQIKHGGTYHTKMEWDWSQCKWQREGDNHVG